MELITHFFKIFFIGIANKKHNGIGMIILFLVADIRQRFSNLLSLDIFRLGVLKLFL